MVHYHLPGNDLSWAKVSLGPTGPPAVAPSPASSFQGGITFSFSALTLTLISARFGGLYLKYLSWKKNGAKKETGPER